MYLNEMLAKLTSNYNSDPCGNIASLFTLPADQMDELNTVLTTIMNWWDIDQAQGATLDRIGVNLNQSRGNLSDDLYRILLKTKAISNLSKGDINTVIEVMATIFQTPVSTVKLTEQYPAGLFFTVPATVIQSSIITDFNTVLSFIQNTVAAGVSITGGFFTGTFLLGDANNPIVNTNTGLSDITQNTGGTLSGFYQ